MRVRFTKGTNRDHVDALEVDGKLLASIRIPRKGFLPHDATHLVVEQVLGYQTAFWGRVFSGESPDQIAQASITGGHASSVRATPPDPEIVELLQAERIVECFEAEIWGSATENETLKDILRAGCAQSHIPEPLLSDSQIAKIRSELAAVASQWKRLASGESMELNWSRK